MGITQQFSRHKNIVWERHVSSPDKKSNNYIHVYVYITSNGTYSYWLDYLLYRGQGTFINWEQHQYSNLKDAIKGAQDFAEDKFFYVMPQLYHDDLLMAYSICEETNCLIISALLLLFI